MEYTLEAADEAGYMERIEGIQFKASVEFMQLIDRYFAHLGNEGMLFKDVTFRDEVLVPAERIKGKFYAYESTWRLQNRMALLTEWL